MRVSSDASSLPRMLREDGKRGCSDSSLKHAPAGYHVPRPKHNKAESQGFSACRQDAIRAASALASRDCIMP